MPCSNISNRSPERRWIGERQGDIGVLVRARRDSLGQVYRERIAAWYNGYLHVAIIYLIGACALYVCLSHLTAVRWWEWLAIPVVLLASNIFEWLLHVQVMHRPRKWKGFRAIYTRHMLMHHQFFTDKEMRFAGHHDWRVTVFPPYALVSCSS